MKAKRSKAIKPQKVIALPGVQPVHFVNHEAADLLQGVVNRLRSGDAVGVAFIALDSDGRCNHNWDVPTRMGDAAFVGVSRLAHALMVSGTKWSAE